MGSLTPSQTELDQSIWPRAGTEQVLSVNNERFMVPEALFHPSDIGMHQAGAHQVLNSPHV